MRSVDLRPAHRVAQLSLYSGHLLARVLALGDPPGRLSLTSIRATLRTEMSEKAQALSEATSKIELPSLTGLRFLAAFSILFSHTCQWTAPFRENNAFAVCGSIISTYGMPLFFLLSGFVIHYNYGPRFSKLPYLLAVREFFAARFARLYPLYFFFIVFGSLSDFTANWFLGYVHEFIQYIGYAITATQSWVYVIVVNDRLVLANGFGLGWSVSTEAFFYIAYIFVTLLILKIKRIRYIILTTVFFCGVVVCVLFFLHGHIEYFLQMARSHFKNFIEAGSNYDQSFYLWFFYYSPYVQIAEFGLGCLTAQLFLVLQRRPVGRVEQICGRWTLYIALYLVVLYGINYGLNASAFQSLTNFFSLNFGCAIPLALIIFCVARYQDSLVANALSTGWMVRLGELSYSIYAIHTWTLRPFVRPAVDYNLVFSLDALLRIPFAMLFTLICASATYRLIELPCRRFLRRKLIPAPFTYASRDQLPSYSPAESKLG